MTISPSGPTPTALSGLARSRLLRRLGEASDAKMTEIERAMGLVLATA
jgi:mRNA-degrading endonuclease toxin of MazEF toxin-antitoxin module